MITVEQAREMSDKAAQPLIQQEINRLFKLIQKRAKRGEYYLNTMSDLSYTLRKEVVRKFNELGYRAYNHSQGTNIEIKWSKE